jgi:hypothetical protein
MHGVERTIDPQDIIVDPRLWLRGIIGTRSVQGFLENVVAEYGELIERGVDMGRLVLVDECDGAGRPSGTLLLVDGFHRFEAMQRLGRTQVDAVVYTGTFDDAVLLACELNANRGLRYSPYQEARVVTAYLTACWHKGENPSDSDIAQRLGVLRERVERARTILTKRDDRQPTPGVTHRT